MQLLGSKAGLRLDEAGEGVSLLPTEPEDMWHAHNLIHPRDLVRAHAVRRVQTISKGTGLSTSSERVHTDLTVRVTSTFFDPAASSLHVTGTVAAENDVANLGQFHTLDLELGRPFKLWKADGWDSVAVEQLRDAIRNKGAGGSGRMALAAVVMHEGLANVCVITENRTVLKQRVEATVPRKAGGQSNKDLEGGMRSFYDKVLAALRHHVDLTTTTSTSGSSSPSASSSPVPHATAGSGPRPLILASPGFTASDFRDWAVKLAVQKSDKELAAVFRAALIVHSSSGHVHALAEVLKSPTVAPLVADARFARETKAVATLRDRLRLDDGRAWYGIACVEKAVAEGAVGRGGGMLLISQGLFVVKGGEAGLEKRKRFVKLVDDVRAQGGEVRILSADHESGQSLESLGAVGALLTFPLFNLDDDVDEDIEADVPEEPATVVGGSGFDEGSFM